MRTLLVVPLLVACTQPHLPETRRSTACEAGSWPGTEVAIRVKVGSKVRNAIAIFPRTAGPHDLVVNMHEFRSNPRTQLKYSGWAKHLDTIDAIVVAPDARYAVWNAGTCCGRAVDKHVDDVAFLDALVARVDEVACTSGRVLATGIGNGAMMAQVWSCESDIPDAVLSVGGSLQWSECRNPRPVPLLHYHGADDTFIPLDGSESGLVAQEDAPFPLQHALDAWAQRNGATETTTVRSGDLHCAQYAGKAPITSCIIQGGADTWPGAPDGAVDSPSPLADATLGGWTWVRHAWDAAASDESGDEGAALDGGTAPGASDDASGGKDTPGASASDGSHDNASRASASDDGTPASDGSHDDASRARGGADNASGARGAANDASDEDAVNAPTSESADGHASRASDASGTRADDARDAPIPEPQP